MTLSAIFLMSLTVLFWGLGAIFDKLSVSHLPPKAVFYGRMYIIFILMLAPMVYAWDDTRLAIMKADRRVIGYLIGTVFFTVGGLYVYYHAMFSAEASVVVPFCSVYPLVTFLLAVAVLKEPFTAFKFAGTLMVVAGIALLSRR